MEMDMEVYNENKYVLRAVHEQLANKAAALVQRNGELFEENEQLKSALVKSGQFKSATELQSLQCKYIEPKLFGQVFKAIRDAINDKTRVKLEFTGEVLHGAISCR